MLSDVCKRIKMYTIFTQSVTLVWDPDCSSCHPKRVGRARVHLRGAWHLVSMLRSSNAWHAKLVNSKQPFEPLP